METTTSNNPTNNEPANNNPTSNNTINNDPANNEPAITKELMDQWLQLIHRATAKKLISFRQRMQLLWLYKAVEKKLGLPQSTGQTMHPPSSTDIP